MSNLSVFPTFQDLKIKKAGKGGFSDGGVVNRSDTLTVSAPVVLAPPPGVNWGGVTLNNPQRVSGVPGGVTGWNFDATVDCAISEYLVFEDGSEMLVDTAVVLDVNTGNTSHAHVSPFFGANGILSYPNKLKYVLSANGSGTGHGIPTARVLIKSCLVEYDQPSDEV